MGRTFELFGLMTFNVFLGLFLSANFLNSAGTHSLTRLDEASVKTFITHIADISMGKDTSMDHLDVTEYFMAHIKDGSNFHNRVTYDLPYVQDNEQETDMDKMTYISYVIRSLSGKAAHHSSDVEIEYIQVSDTGDSATVMTVNHESGQMPVGQGGDQARMIPVAAASYCEHELVLTKDKKIQLAGANCMTDISRDGY